MLPFKENECGYNMMEHPHILAERLQSTVDRMRWHSCMAN